MLSELEIHKDNIEWQMTWLNYITEYVEAMKETVLSRFETLFPLLFYWLHASDNPTWT